MWMDPARCALSGCTVRGATRCCSERGVQCRGAGGPHAVPHAERECPVVTGKQAGRRADAGGGATPEGQVPITNVGGPLTCSGTRWLPRPLRSRSGSAGRQSQRAGPGHSACRRLPPRTQGRSETGVVHEDLKNDKVEETRVILLGPLRDRRGRGHDRIPHQHVVVDACLGAAIAQECLLYLGHVRKEFHWHLLHCLVDGTRFHDIGDKATDGLWTCPRGQTGELKPT